MATKTTKTPPRKNPYDAMRQALSDAKALAASIRDCRHLLESTYEMEGGTGRATAVRLTLDAEREVEEATMSLRAALDPRAWGHADRP